MPKFRKKPVIIEAEQFQGDDVRGVCMRYACVFGDKLKHVHTAHNDQKVYIEVGDWIIPEPDGVHFYPCKPDIFRSTYEEVHGDGIVD